MSEKLPPPKVIVPVGDRGALTAMLMGQAGDMRDHRPDAERGGYDSKAKLNQAIANADELLDHYPNGAPRDHIVAYGGRAAISNADPKILENIQLGQD